MRDYNGFTGAQRAKAQSWLNSQWRAERFARPSVCCACGQSEGIIDAHAEDYSEPFSYEKLMRYPLCFVCHMMVHCRFRNWPAWDAYRALIGDGWRMPGFYTRNFPLFSSMYLKGDVGRFIVVEGRQLVPHVRRPLDGINGRPGTRPSP